jgi:hypothetical protein
MDNKETAKITTKNSESNSPPRKSTKTKIEQVSRFIVKTTEIEYIIEQPITQQLNHVFGL